MKNKFTIGQKVVVSGESSIKGSVGIISEEPYEAVDMYQITFDNQTTSSFFEDELTAV